MKIVTKTIKYIILLFLCLVLLVNLWLLAARFLLHQDLPKMLGFSQAVVLSGSMEPAFSVGDMLIFHEAKTYEVNDTVIFRQGDSFVTHRIAGEREGGFATKGDANNTQDTEILYPEQIEGKLFLIIPGFGGVLTFLRTPLGMLLIIGAGIALIEIPNIVDEKRKQVMRDEKAEINE